MMILSIICASTIFSLGFVVGLVVGAHNKEIG